MPNIELHGWDSDTEMLVADEVIEILKGLGLAKDAVISSYPFPVYRAERRDSVPFVRVISSEAAEAKLIASVLHQKDPGLDIEYTHIDGFIEGEG